MIEGMMIGFNTAFSGYNILMVMMGCFAGTIIGMLPGLGPMSAIALMIPITYGFDPASAMILMAGVYYGAIFGGSTSSSSLMHLALQEQFQALSMVTQCPKKVRQVRLLPLRLMLRSLAEQLQLYFC